MLGASIRWELVAEVAALRYTVGKSQLGERYRNAARMKPADRPAFLSFLRSLLISMALVHGLVALPLLVECLPADGRSLVELIGQDPCHHPFGEMEAGRGHDLSSSLLGEDDPSDPCLDLSMENTGMAQNAVALPAPPMSATDQVADATCIVIYANYLSNECTTFKLAREPLITAGRDLLLTSALRI
jgi:hypothetical protein